VSPLSDLEESPAVLLVPSASVPSGVVTYVLGEASALGPMPHAVVAEPGSALAQSLPPGCGLVPAGPGLSGLIAALMRNQARFAFVQAHGPRALLAARLSGVPSRRLGYTFHEMDGARARFELRLARRGRVAGNGPITADWASRRLGVDVDTLPPILNMVTPLARAEARAQLGLPAEPVIIGVVGRLSKVKWPLLAVEAVARNRLSVILAFVGDGPEDDAIRSAAAGHGVEVHMVGSVPDAGRLMTAFDVLLSCSPRETFGLAAAEAMVASVPVVGVDSPGLRLLTDGGRLQRLIAPDPGAVAAALSTAAASGPPPPNLREHVLSQFALEASSARIRRHYESALSGARR
jgi:glycosyltransferase involved in cell wall biosynthesis